MLPEKEAWRVSGSVQWVCAAIMPVGKWQLGVGQGYPPSAGNVVVVFQDVVESYGSV